MRTWQNAGALRRATLFLTFVSSLPAPLAWSQTRSSVTGTITDGTGAVLRGATVVIESPNAVGGAQTVTTDERGTYRFADLPVGTYSLTASLGGFRTVERRGLRLPFGTTLTVDVSLEVGSAETLTVEGETPTVDVTTAQAAVTVDKDLIENLPLFSNLREANTIFELSPGSTYGAAFGGGGNNINIDGVPATMSFGQSQSSVVIAPAWLDEVNVVALGASAEHGEFGGVNANYVVRSGSNDFHGMLEYRTTRPEWMEDNTEGQPPAVRTRLRSAKIFSRWDALGQFGGPIVKDKLFFFGGMQYFKDETQNAGTIAPATTKWPRYVGKLNWAISKNVKSDSTYSYNKSSVESWAPNVTLDAGGLTEQPGHFWAERITWTPNNKTLWEFKTGGMHWIQDVGPIPPNTKEGPPPRRDVVTGIQCCNTLQYRTQTANRITFAANVTRQVDDLAGRHAFKLGMEYEDQQFTTVGGFAGGMSFTDRNGVPDMVTIWAGDTVKGVGKRTTFYVMDDWKVSKRVTLQPGVRFSLDRGSTPTTGTTFEANPISPRLGIAWDVGKGHKTVIRGHYGRFHASNSTDVWDFMDTATRTPTITARVLPNGSLQEINRVTPAANFGIDPDIGQAYVDQFFVGVEHQFFKDFSVKLNYVHKESKNNYALIDTRSVFTPVQQRDPGVDNVAGNADDGQVLTVFALTNPGQAFFLQTNPDDAERKYDGFQIVAQKRFAKRWQLLASYTRSDSRGLLNNANLAQSVGTAGIWANPNSAINAEGRNGLDFPNQASLRATYHAPWLGGFNLSSSWIYASGVAWSRTATFRLPQGNVNVRVAPRGTEPASSTNQLDLRLEKLVPLGSPSRNFGFYVDCFNVMNKGFPPQTRYNEASGATFGQPLNWVEGRAFKVGVRLTM